METEARLAAALDSLRPGRLLIVITHRPALARKADRILYIEQGEVLEEGSHAELMARDNGRYRHYMGA